MQNGKNKPKSLGEEGSEVSVQMGSKSLLRALKRKLEHMELEHLRQHALELNERLEQAEEQLRNAEETALFQHENYMQIQEAFYDENYATHRSIGITKDGALLVVKTEDMSNKALIAAAPELLRALRLAESFIVKLEDDEDYTEGQVEVLHMIRATINKVEEKNAITLHPTN